MTIINLYMRKFYNNKLRKKLKNHNFSLISSNCNGAFILHDLGEKFCSPTVNLWFEPKDFIKFLKNLEEYTKVEIAFDDELEKKYGYPVGKIGNDIKIYFQHYDSREEAKRKWVQRCERIDFSNLFVLFTDRDGCSKDDLLEFDKLPYNKIVLTNKEYEDIKSCFYIRGFEDESSIGNVYKFVNFFSKYKYYDQFPYIDWFNGNWHK